MKRLVVSLFLVLSAFAHAENLGSYGGVWDIQEQDGVDQVKDKLKKWGVNGKEKQFWESYRDKSVAKIENPDPVPGYSKATKNNVRFFDPSYRFETEQRDQNGRVVVPAGTVVNPFSYVRWSKSYLFVDLRDARQVEFARKRLEANPTDKVIGVAGAPLKLAREWGNPVYFDQKGVLTKKFGLNKTPSIVSQDGMKIKITEVAL